VTLKKLERVATHPTWLRWSLASKGGGTYGTGLPSDFTSAPQWLGGPSSSSSYSSDMLIKHQSSLLKDRIASRSHPAGAAYEELAPLGRVHRPHM
jgi:hypothetical protein